MEKRQSSVELSVDDAYGVITAIIEAMDKTATRPNIYPFFLVELLKKMPRLLDALMTVTKAEHRELIGQLVKAYSRVTGEWLKTVGR